MFKKFEDFLAANGTTASVYAENIRIALEKGDTDLDFGDLSLKVPRIPLEKLLAVRDEILIDIDNKPLNASIRERMRACVKKELNEIRGAITYDRRKAEGILKDCFKKYLCKDLPPDLLKVSDLIFDRAWSEGHAYGYHNVEICFIDLADFVGDVVKKMKE